MATVKRHKYDGILATPIVFTVKTANALLGRTAEDRERAKAQLSADYGARVVALVKDCSEDPKNPDWLAVALELASRHVPGFDITEQPERGLTERELDAEEIIVEMLELTERNLSIRNAAERVSRKRKKHGETPAAIDRRYRRWLKENGGEEK
jgi:hypothetical protein